MELLRKHLLREGHINKPELIQLIAAAVAIMSKCLILFGRPLAGLASFWFG